KVTGLGTATIGDYTALAYDGDIPVLVYSETQEVEGLTSVTIRCLVANAAGPSELADFTASEVVDLGDTSIHGLAVEVNSSHRIVIVYSTDEGVSAAVSLTGTEDPPTDSSGWDVSAIDSDPLAGHQ